jgi:hypothetical protein
MKKIPVPTASFIFRPFLFLLVGLGLGYWLGYTDAWRGDRTLGARMAMLKYRIHPSGGVSEQRQKNAEKIREHVRASSGIDSLLPP